MTLTAPVIAVRDGLATVGIGYGDGVPSSAAGVQVSLEGVRHRVVSVQLDVLTVDTGKTIVRTGDTAILFGSGTDGEPTLQEWADALGTIGEEIVTRLSPRIRRRFLE